MAWNFCRETGMKMFLFSLSTTLGLISACGGGESRPPDTIVLAQRSSVAAPKPNKTNLSAASNSSLIAVAKLTKVSEARVGRTTFDYVFRLTVINSGPPATEVKFTITSAGSGTSIIDGIAAVGSLDSGQAVDLVDTITLRQDRQFPFSPDALSWVITAEQSQPPDIRGSDADGNGVRDDVQAYITTRVGDQLPIVDALFQLAKSYQSVATATDQTQFDAIEKARREAAICLSDRSSPSRALELMAGLRAMQLNTGARYSAELAFRNQLAGKTVVVELSSLEGTCK
jgi:hypothetical protein